jgi:3',5'-cyclic AMP phosphodiesterase CpdA
MKIKGFHLLWIELVFIALIWSGMPVLASGEVAIPGDYYASRADKVPERIILSYSDDPATTISVTWRTGDGVASPGAQIALAGNNKASLESNAVSEKAVSQSLAIGTKTVYQIRQHSVTFRGLLPDTAYCYRVEGGGEWSEWFQFRTASTSSKPFRFIYLGDAQTDLKEHFSRVARSAFAHAGDAAFVIHAGDLVSKALSDNWWGDWFYALGFISGTVPHLPVPGNHEYIGRDQITPLWRTQFTLPENGLEGLEETSYYIDYQGVKFVFLNSSEQPEKQAVWLDRLLTKNKSQWTIVTLHHPMYNTGDMRSTDRYSKIFVPVFDAHDVDLVLQGHDHTYARTYKLSQNKVVGENRRGTVYVTSVAGGKMYGKNEAYLDLMAKYALATQTFQIISIDNRRPHYEARAASGELLDSFDLAKDKE